MFLSFLLQAYQLDCYFRQSWVDERLQFPGPLDRLQVSISILDRLWKPDTHFFNGKRSYLHTVPTPNKFLRISRNGRIIYSMRLFTFYSLLTMTLWFLHILWIFYIYNFVNINFVNINLILLSRDDVKFHII